VESPVKTTSDCANNDCANARLLKWEFDSIDNAPKEKEKRYTLTSHVEYFYRNLTMLTWCPRSRDYLKNMVNCALQMTVAYIGRAATDVLCLKTRRHPFRTSGCYFQERVFLNSWYGWWWALFGISAENGSKGIAFSMSMHGYNVLYLWFCFASVLMGTINGFDTIMSFEMESCDTGSNLPKRMW